MAQDSLSAKMETSDFGQNHQKTKGSSRIFFFGCVLEVSTTRCFQKTGQNQPYCAEKRRSEVATLLLCPLAKEILLSPLGVLNISLVRILDS